MAKIAKKKKKIAKMDLKGRKKQQKNSKKKKIAKMDGNE